MEFTPMELAPTILAAGAAGAGALLLARPRARVTLTTWLDRHMEPGWYEAAQAAPISAISVKLNEGGARFTSSKQTLATVQAGRLPLETWGYYYARTVDEARQEGQRTAELIAQYAPTTRAHYLDLEHQWAGIWGAPRTEDPEAAALALIESLRFHLDRLGLHHVLIVWNGLSARWYDDARGRRLAATPRVIAACDVYCPQCYAYHDQQGRRIGQTGTRELIRDRARRHIIEAPDHAAARVRIRPMVGSGRLVDDGTIATAYTGPDALPGLLIEYGINELAIWYGGGSRGMLTEGQGAVSPPLGVALQPLGSLFYRLTHRGVA